MTEKCRYGRESEIFYEDSKRNEVQYKCPRDAEIDDFCIFHTKWHWKQNKETEEKVRTEFMEEIERAKHGEDIQCIGYNLPDIKIWEWKPGERLEIKGFVNFGKTRFQVADFHGVTFHKGVVFEGAVFDQDVIFSSVVFNEQADFKKVKFIGSAVFRNAKFMNEADFSNAIFHKLANFIEVEFKEETNFRSVIFQQQANFNAAIFKQRTYFSYAEFNGPASFLRTVFITEEEETIEDIETRIEFTLVKLQSPKEVVFESCCLNYVSFIHTDLTKITFRNITWPRSNVLLDDKLHESHKKGKLLIRHYALNISSVLAVYRMLRENYEYNVDYETAGRFFVGEMEARRRNSSSRPDKFILWLYKTLSLYGQSYIRPLLFLIGLIIVFSFLRVGQNSIVPDIISNNIIAASLWKSIAVSSQFRGTEWIDILQWVLSIPLLVLFGLALRRRFERRFRH